MNILGIDTTKKQAYVFGVFNGKKVIDILPTTEKHSENLLTHIEGVLNFNQVDISEIDVFANVSGPGSFTGIRIGLTTVKALNLPFNKKIVNINVFEGLKSYIKNGVLLLECTQSSVYFGKYKNSKVIDYGVLDYDQLANQAFDCPIYVLQEEQLNLPLSYKVNVIKNYANLILEQIILEVNNSSFTKTPMPFYIALSQAEKNLLEIERSQKE